MSIVYDPEQECALFNDDEHTAEDFYCGDDLDKIGSIVLQLNYRLISPQKAYTLLMREMNK